MEEKIRGVLKRSKTRSQYITIEGDRVYIGIRETVSSNQRAYKSLQSLGLTPINCVYGRWVFRVNNYTGGEVNE